MTALINDTTGTLIASHYVNPKTKIAVIFGTGCNAAYMERVGSIPKIKNLGIDDDAQMGINCEWVRAFLLIHEQDADHPSRVHLIPSRMRICLAQSTTRLWMKHPTSLVNRHLRCVIFGLLRDCMISDLLIEINFWKISRRNSATRYHRTHRRGCPILGTRHLQARDAICIRNRLPIVDGKVQMFQ